jgi:hypothetical protein
MTTALASHTFHVPVMGIAFTIDSPIKLAHLGISSVISLVDDELIEQMRAFYAQQFSLKYEAISAKIEDYRAKRITAYLNLVKEIVELRFQSLKTAAFKLGSDLEQYINLLPTEASLRHQFYKLIKKEQISEAEQKSILDQLQMGSIDVNIMTKLDKENSVNGQKLEHIYNDAHAALRGFAQSNLEAGVVLSAGLNPRLYSYFEQFADFYPNAEGLLKKRIILKISDYRSALIQGKFLAKKGLWVSEFRMESGLNCGGHAFATDGLLMGPILNEFKENRESLKQELFQLYAKALTEKQMNIPSAIPEQKFTAQGGVGTAAEQQFLIEAYGLDSVGWGTPFLLVPEATTVDEATMQRLCEAKEKDLYLSHNSPLGVRFNNIHNHSMAGSKENLIIKDRPGSSCPKKYSVLDKTYTEDPICIASRQYQHAHLKHLIEAQLQGKEKVNTIANSLAKECLCVGLTNSALMVHNLPQKHYKDAVSICPGPNMAYYDKVVSLRTMADHIYGRGNVLADSKRPHVFVKELTLYLNYFEELIAEYGAEPNKQQTSTLQAFEKNLLAGIGYYKQLFEPIKFDTEREALQILELRFANLLAVEEV